MDKIKEITNIEGGELAPSSNEKFEKLEKQVEELSPKLGNEKTKGRKELSEIQRFAIQAARERAVEAQNVLNRILSAILKEFSIPETELPEWEFADNFKYLQKIKREPKLTIPSDKGK